MIFSSSCLIGAPPAFRVSAASLSQPHALLFLRDLTATSTSANVKGSLPASVFGGSGMGLEHILISRKLGVKMRTEVFLPTLHWPLPGPSTMFLEKRSTMFLENFLMWLLCHTWALTGRCGRRIKTAELLIIPFEISTWYKLSYNTSPFHNYKSFNHIMKGQVPTPPPPIPFLHLHLAPLKFKLRKMVLLLFIFYFPLAVTLSKGCLHMTTPATSLHRSKTCRKLYAMTIIWYLVLVFYLPIECTIMTWPDFLLCHYQEVINVSMCYNVLYMYYTSWLLHCMFCSNLLLEKDAEIKWNEAVAAYAGLVFFF